MYPRCQVFDTGKNMENRSCHRSNHFKHRNSRRSFESLQLVGWWCHWCVWLSEIINVPNRTDLVAWPECGDQRSAPTTPTTFIQAIHHC